MKSRGVLSPQCESRVREGQKQHFDIGLSEAHGERVQDTPEEAAGGHLHWRSTS